MEKMKDLEPLDPMGFVKIVPGRMEKIEAAPATPIVFSDPIGKLARYLHPLAQYLVIDKIVEHGEDAKSFTLVPDTSRGTQELAYFIAGQYLSFSLNIDGAIVAKPYSICSAPEQAFNGSYEILVKRAEDPFASDYILNNWKVGDAVEASGPEGNFTYEPYRDAKHVIGLAGGSGITPFYSLACAIADGTEDFELTLLYGSRNSEDILLKDAFDALEAACPAIKVVHVLSEEEADGYESGFLTAELIKKYAPEEEYSIFICGPQVMHAFVDGEIEKLNLPVKYVRHELFGEFKNPEKNDDYPQDAFGKEFVLTVQVRDEEFKVPCLASETLLVALDRAKIPSLTKCRSGECGYCRSLLLEGDIYAPESVDARRNADYRYGYIHPCCSFPVSDVTIEIPSR